MKAIGIMQGRLVPRYQGRYQAFPAGYWSAEFHIARELGFQHIEFILDHGTETLNPLMSNEGIQELKTVISESGVTVRSICADYFMQAPFHSEHREKSVSILKTLIRNSAQLGVTDIVIPCVDQSSMKSASDQNQVTNSIAACLSEAEAANININFETDLAPKPFRDFLNSFQSRAIKVNYDSGNSASLGYRPNEEFEMYGDFVSDVHIKDRVFGGGSVELGTGHTQFDEFFGCLKAIGFKGLINLQASRADEYRDEAARVSRQLEFTRRYVERYLESRP